ncbi:MAG TPA: hypothetical protein DEP84_23540 [Chloroflexi bacterium]|nr:hypothetical protein [Chloroflexota bacterium]
MWGDCSRRIVRSGGTGLDLAIQAEQCGATARGGSSDPAARAWIWRSRLSDSDFELVRGFLLS